MTNLAAIATSTPTATVEHLLEEEPQRAPGQCRSLWDAQIAIDGPLPNPVGPRLDLLAVTRLAALTTDLRPVMFNDAVVGAAPSDPISTPALHLAAASALVRPEIMRWITANARSVADQENWRAILPGLGGATISVPLAEEALSNVMKTRKKLTSELTEMVQLNPWFSRRFAVRYRRRMKGKRLRISERGATLRAWSHARTLLQPQIPEPWTSLLKRGVGRPLDWWSEDLLTDYTNLMLETFEGHGIPATMAPLFAIASAGIGRSDIPEDAARSWDVLPLDVEAQARRLIDLPLREVEATRRTDAETIRRAGSGSSSTAGSSSRT